MRGEESSAEYWLDCDTSQCSQGEHSWFWSPELPTPPTPPRTRIKRINTIFYRKLGKRKRRNIVIVLPPPGSPTVSTMWAESPVQNNRTQFSFLFIHFWQKGSKKASSWTRFRNTLGTPWTGLWGNTCREKIYISIRNLFSAKLVGKTGEKMPQMKVNFICR